jgi:predicted HNH restriction endonuclease
LAWDRIQEELDICVLLCANCHAEAHAGDTRSAPSDSSQSGSDMGKR